MEDEQGKNPMEPKHRDWIKLYIKECLLGTIREDLSPEERGTWYDFLILAGNSRVSGVICANRSIPYSNSRITQILNISEELLLQCLTKFEQSGRIRIRKGLIYIINWDRYQYSDYDRQKPYQQAYRQQLRESAPESSDFPTFVEELRPAYPHLDIAAELIKFNEWWSRSDRKLKRPKLAFKNWLERAGKFQSKSVNKPPSSKAPARRTYDSGLG